MSYTDSYVIIIQGQKKAEKLNIDQIQVINFTTHKDFSLCNSFWGSAPPYDIINLLDSVIMDFYSNLDSNRIITLPVFVLNSSVSSPPKEYPERIKVGSYVLIYLTTQDLYWSQYSYQFSHELCHHIIDTDFPPKNDKFGWFEESLCELASLYTLNKMSITWQTNPPYSNWKNYSGSLKDYVTNKLVDPENNIVKPFNEWLSDNLPELYKDRCKRSKNQIIAIKLLPIFTDKPDLWQSIQYIKEIVITNQMTLEQYLFAWKKLIPLNLHSNFDNIIELFVHNISKAS